MADYFQMGETGKKGGKGFPFGKVIFGVGLGLSLLYGGCRGIIYAGSSVHGKVTSVYSEWRAPEVQEEHPRDFPIFEIPEIKEQPDTLDALVGSPLQLPNGMKFHISNKGGAVQSKYLQYLNEQQYVQE